MIKLVAEGNLSAGNHEDYGKPLVIPLNTVRRIRAKIDVWEIELNDGKTIYHTEGCIPLRFKDQEDVRCSVLLVPDMGSGYYDLKTDHFKPDATFDVGDVAEIYLHDYCEFSIRKNDQPYSGKGCPESYLQECTEIRFRFE